jgi:hypothetical protein
MKKLSVLFLLVLVNFLALGQSTQEWQRGAVVLSNNLVLTGELLLHLDFNTLVVNDSNERLVLPASTIKSFRYYDKANNINRQYVTLDDLQSGTSAFYELIVQGEYKVLRKQKRIHSVIPDDREDYVYFTFNDGILTHIRNFRKKVFPQLLKSTPDLNTWVHEQRLDLNSSETALLVVMEYNRLRNANQLVASC